MIMHAVDLPTDTTDVQSIVPLAIDSQRAPWDVWTYLPVYIEFAAIYMLVGLVVTITSSSFLIEHID
eukprot:COSAG05_NODE_13525_length_426_cov_3.324159_1_plen_67_part_00